MMGVQLVGFRIVGAALLAACPAIVAAQAPLPAPVTSPFCFRGRPLPICDSFLLFEFGGNGRLFTTHQVPGGQQVDVAEAGNGFAALDIGAMVNRPNGTAVGGSIQIGSEDASRRRLALEARHRTWLTRTLAVDVGAGPLEINTRKSFAPLSRGGYGITTHAGLVVMDLATVTTSVDLVRGQRTQFTLNAGGRLGSYPAAALIFLVSLLAAGYHDPN
jgi:hypothetical protein